MLLGWGELLQCLSQHSCIKTQREFYITVNKACMRSNLSKLCIFYIKNNAVKLLTCKWNTSRQASIYHAHKSLSNHHMRYSEKVYLHHQKDSEARWQLTVSLCSLFVAGRVGPSWNASFEFDLKRNVHVWRGGDDTQTNRRICLESGKRHSHQTCDASHSGFLKDQNLTQVFIPINTVVTNTFIELLNGF